MPVYGTPDAVKGLLDNADMPDFTAAQDTRITDLLAVVSGIIESQTGATFLSSAPSETTRDIEAEGGSTLFLSIGVRSVASITESPDWVNGAWTGGTVLSTSAYRLTGRTTDSGAYRAIRRMDGGWFGAYVISAVWEDTYPTVPAEIDYLANYISAELFKKQPMSPAGFVGPDNTAVSLRNAFAEPEVRAIINKYRVGAMMLAV